MLPTITIEGNLVADPEMRFTPSGKQLAEFRVAATRRKRNDRGEWYDDKQVFLKVTVWDLLAENVANSLHKGDGVVVVGQLYQDEWEGQDGQRRTEVKMEGRNVGVSLLRAETEVRRVPRQSAAPAPAPAHDPWSAAPAPTPQDVWGHQAGDEPPF